MKKRLITLFVAFVMMFSLIVPAYAAESTEAPAAESKAGGLDFYSITINYTKDILVDYTNVGKSASKPDYRFQDESGNKVMADKVVLRAGVQKENDYIGYDKSKQADQSNFYQLTLPSAGINATATYGNFPYEYAYITHIQNGTILQSKSSFGFYGIDAPYDEGEAYKNQNPNVVYNQNGYALDVQVDEKGNNYYIDINGYQVGADGLWYDHAGYRVELFYEVPVMNYVGDDTKYVECTRAYTDELVHVDYDLRFDSKTGMIKNYDDMTAYFYITKADLIQFFKDNKGKVSPTSPVAIPLKLLDPSAEDYEAQLEKILNKGSDKADVLKFGEKYKKDYYYVKATLSSYRVVRDSSTVSADGTVVVDSSKEMSKELYSAKDTKFTSDYIARDSVGNMIRSTPNMGTPKLNVEIESISVEVAAMGTQTYDNAAADPQSKNKITVSINDFAQNVALKEQALADKWISQSTFDSYNSKILGTVSSKTTSTEAEWDTSKIVDGQYKQDKYASIDLGISKEELNKLPRNATIFVSFEIETAQAEGAFSETYTPSTAKVATGNAKIWERPAEQEKSSNVQGDPMLFVWIGIAAVVVIVIAVVLVVVLKKKKK